jgi:hypothetical protein
MRQAIRNRTKNIKKLRLLNRESAKPLFLQFYPWPTSQVCIMAAVVCFQTKPEFDVTVSPTAAAAAATTPSKL